MWDDAACGGADCSPSLSSQPGLNTRLHSPSNNTIQWLQTVSPTTTNQPTLRAYGNQCHLDTDYDPREGIVWKVLQDIINHRRMTILCINVLLDQFRHQKWANNVQSKLSHYWFIWLAPCFLRWLRFLRLTGTPMQPDKQLISTTAPV